MSYIVNFIIFLTKGIPDPLRGQVWQMMAGVKENDELIEGYKHFIKKVDQSAGYFSQLIPMR